MTTISHSTFICPACGQDKDSAELYVTRSRFTLCNSCAIVGKYCPACETYKLFSAFAKAYNGSHRGGVSGYCKSCKRVRNSAEYSPSRQRTHNLKVRFNLTPAEYDKIFSQQSGLCAICNKPETAIDGASGKVRALAVDHNHKTGAIRQLLCSSCNYWLGAIEKEYDRIEGMMKYLKKHEPASEGN